MVVLISKLSFIIHRDGPDGETPTDNNASAASWVTSHTIERHLEGLVKEAFPNSGPTLPTRREENEKLRDSEFVAAIVKGFEKGYNKEKVLHSDPRIK